MLVAIIAAMQFAGYVAIRVFGHRLGMMLLGFFGGLVSSTAVFATLPQISRKNTELLRPSIVAAIYSVIGMLVEIIIVLAFIAPQLMTVLTAPILAMIAVGASSAILIYKGKQDSQVMTEPTNPLDIKSVIRLATIIGGMLFIVALAKRQFGTEGIQYVTFIGALFEIHGVIIANATLFVENKLTLNNASTIIAYAILASYVSKFILLWSLARNRFAVITSLFLLAMIAAGGIVFWLM